MTSLKIIYTTFYLVTKLKHFKAKIHKKYLPSTFPKLLSVLSWASMSILLDVVEIIGAYGVCVLAGCELFPALSVWCFACARETNPYTNLERDCWCQQVTIAYIHDNVRKSDTCWVHIMNKQYMASESGNLRTGVSL